MSQVFVWGEPCLDWASYKVVYGWCYKSHQAVWKRHIGFLPASGEFICHYCDNRECFNPSHFWLGTGVDNAQDRNEKGRWRLCKIK